ncbi:MAG TPA: NAD(P)-binding protein [Planktothrix sp.]|jgi:hypothetical protein
MIAEEESNQSAALLEKFKFKPIEGVYILGCTASALYIHAQQQRAFNLVWALKREGRINDGCEVAVVGGGIAGLTACGALAAAKVKVKIFERMHRPLCIQRGNLTRFVHPNVARWPDDTSGYPITHLPFMNWRAGIVGTVNTELERQWDAAREVFKKKGCLEVLLGQEAINVAWNDSDKLVSLTVNGTVRKFRSVILAVGYGIELSKHGTSSYWHNDDFAQPVLGPEKQKNYLVSGIGDGALTEVLRLKLTDFNHHKFIESVIFDPKLKAAGEKAKNKNWDLWEKKGEELKAEFPKFFYDKPDTMAEPKVRQDTKLVLVGSEDEPHADRPPDKNPAQILHRVCVKLLRDAGELDYRKGRLKDFENEEEFKDYTIVQRHGSEKSLVRLLGCNNEDDTKYKELVKSWKDNDQQDPKTFVPHYGKGFLANELMESHFEKSYEVGIRLTGNSEEDAAKIKYILEKAGAQEKAVNGESETPFTCKHGEFTLKLQPVPTIFYAYPKGELLTRYHVPAQFPNGVILRTALKRVLDLLFDDEKLPYHLYRVFLADNFPENDPERSIDQFVNTDTWLYILDQRKKGEYLEVICAEGMHQAHTLLRVPMLIEVMGNNWPTKSVHGLGWAVKNTSATNLKSQRGNELLQRSV